MDNQVCVDTLGSNALGWMRLRHGSWRTKRAQSGQVQQRSPHSAGRVPSNMSSTASVAAGDVEVVTEISQNDVLLGRGAMAIGNEGNIRFRALVRLHQSDYVSTSRRRKKEKIADEVRLTVADRNGRFLRRIESQQEMQKLGISPGIEGL